MGRATQRSAAAALARREEQERVDWQQVPMADLEAARRRRGEVDGHGDPDDAASRRCSRGTRTRAMTVNSSSGSGVFNRKVTAK